MKSILEALKRVRGEKPERGEMDRAPKLDSQDGDSEGLVGVEEVSEDLNEEPKSAEEIMALSDEEKARLLESLISEPQGRAPMGLHERASQKMQGDLDKLKKV
jgi:hypothetical protein